MRPVPASVDLAFSRRDFLAAPCTCALSSLFSIRVNALISLCSWTAGAFLGYVLIVGTRLFQNRGKRHGGKMLSAGRTTSLARRRLRVRVCARGWRVSAVVVFCCCVWGATGIVPKTPPPAPEGVSGEDVVREMIGAWQHNASKLAELAKVFNDAHPFPYVVIDNFFSTEAADRLEQRFPAPNGTRHDWLQQGWHIYDNPIEGKLVHDNLERMGEHDGIFTSMWDALQSDAFVGLMRHLTGIKDLESDPYLHGGGIHLHPPGSRLEMHLDYSIHPISKKERRVNLIVYMNRGWQEEWGGHLELWEGTVHGLKAGVSPEGGTGVGARGVANGERRGEAARIAPTFNRAVLFRTSDVSWHGMPDPVACPQGQARKSVAIYYMSEARPIATPRFKASYRPRPGYLQPSEEEGYKQLCKIREVRRLEHDDVKQHLPGFEPRWKDRQLIL